MKATASVRRDHVRLEQRGDITDEFGNVTIGGGDYELRAECWARIMPMRGSETVIAARLTGTQPAIITVPINPDTEALMSDWRVVHSVTGKVYEIKSFANMDEHGAQWEILAESQT